MVTFNLVEGEDNTQEIRRILEEEYFPENKKNTLHALYRKYHILPKRFSRVAKDMLREQGKPPILKGRHKRKPVDRNTKHNIYVKPSRSKRLFMYTKITNGERVCFCSTCLEELEAKAAEYNVKLNEDRLNELRRLYGE